MNPAHLRLPRVTASSAGTYLTCPRQFWHEYVRKPRLPRRGGPWAHLSRGLSIHAALSLLMDEPPERRTPDRAVALLAQCWQTGGYRDEKQNGNAFIEAAEWIERYVSKPEGRDAVAVANERPVSAIYRDAVILDGRVDRIDEREPATPERPGTLVVVDYKTGSKPSTQEEASSSYALAIYVFATMNGPLGKRSKSNPHWCTRAELHHVPSGTVVTVEYDGERMTRILDRLLDLVREIERARKTAQEAADSLPKGEAEAVATATFPARPGRLCASCDFLDYCDEGKARAKRADGWAYLDGERVSQQ